MKLFKLIVHTRGFNPADILVNPKDYPGIKEGDVVEIYHPEDEFSRLLLQITCFKEDLQGRGNETISVEQSIAQLFMLRTYGDIYMRVVQPSEVVLDSVEITFKDQYMGRSEMWRLKNFLTNTCVYMNKKIEYCNSSIRCQVYEMWGQGERVACGVIGEETKVVFRSSTSMVYLFIQMSSEMWDFDIHGDLYFEKAINGFLADLFMKWKKLGSNHEVTIVLFSRSFYAAESLEEFPQHMRECLQIDYRGRFYEDFYRVAVQNERYDDWSGILVQLRKLFTSYQQIILNYHEKPGVRIPQAINSTAAQGNFLEVLNMSLNVFEKHYLDRSFDRTGQLSVVITPGVGVFEVDRELTNVTKQRIIDNGVGSDLVCVGEQPLHAVPLLKFHNKDGAVSSISDDYSMPHWINLSFYSTNKKVAYSTFIPRIKLPPKKSSNDFFSDWIVPLNGCKSKLLPDTKYMHNSLFDYDAYDSIVFQLPATHGTCLQREPRIKKTSLAGLENKQISLRQMQRKMSDPDIHHGLHNNFNYSSVAQRRTNNSPYRPPEPLLGPLIRAGRALINPFDPSHVTIKLTSNRRRWTHIFPKGPTGVLIQQHHDTNDKSLAEMEQQHIYMMEIDKHRSDTTNVFSDFRRKLVPSHTIAGANMSDVPSRSLTLLWGATGEQEWTPDLTTGVDWKSLTIPACLPITTDYFPDEVSLQNDYVLSDYNLLPDDVNADFAQNRAVYKKPLTTNEVFKELVSQRLAQGFQLIVLPNYKQTKSTLPMLTMTPSTVAPFANPASNTVTNQYLLSIGRVFHKITLNVDAITVTRYRPRHPYPPFNVHYRYRFHAPHHDTYEVSWVSFTTEKIENFNWNYVDHYICTRGDTDFALAEALKYWRFRMYILPLSNVATRKIMDGTVRCDIYQEPTLEEQNNIIDGFLKFVETFLNKIRRPSHVKLGGSGKSAFRERLGSNRMDKPRPRSGSKVMERRIASSDSNLSTDLITAADIGDETKIEITKLRTGATNLEILDAMKNSPDGIGFLNHTQSLPSYTFVSTDACTWLLDHLEGVTSIEAACVIMKQMLKDRLICHASGDFDKPFIIGFYLYYIVPQEKDQKGIHLIHTTIHKHEAYMSVHYLSDYIQPLFDLESFENEWMEVGIKFPNKSESQEHESSKESQVVHFLRDVIVSPVLEDQEYDGSIYKQTHLEIDVNNKSDRIEWGHALYHSVMRPMYAYELVVQWLTASGTIVADLVMGWSRKAQSCSLQMVPIPADPMAQPFTAKSDPLRGPIFIPLHTHVLCSQGHMFKEFPEETWGDRLLLLQHEILSRFGFLRCTVESAPGTNMLSSDHHYIHCTGNMFILIPSQLSLRPRPRSMSINQRRASSRYPVLPSKNDVGQSPHEAYITRHVSGKHKGDHDGVKRVGFLWSWNHMISKKWKSPSTNATGDETFQIKLLRDFKNFCSNTDQRLVDFWEDCWKTKEMVSTAAQCINSTKTIDELTPDAELLEQSL
ncbi:GATOR complex protein DEPDC5 isoform X3 [Ctenocephalides felis]|uniref:GATOR complex protein DEPDC5 isoform X3 n=1 Tax=Ctenocephalides felis TaxID=7515 RepID=UPI000E6E19B7|nr:GATOR complex protein DEPDC5 isoform X3 [Ctenocephalides felis]